MYQFLVTDNLIRAGTLFYTVSQKQHDYARHLPVFKAYSSGD
jgi:hypothetical protein